MTAALLWAALLPAAVAGSLLGLAAAEVAAGRLRRVRPIRARRRYVAEELPACLHLLIGALRAGFGLLQALAVVAREGPPLLGAEVQQVIHEVNLGASLEGALERMAARLASADIDLFVTALLISREVGGNLSETLAHLQETIRARARLRRQLRVLTAQARLSGAIVALLPLFLALVLTLINPGYTGILFTTGPGRLLLGLSLVSQALGVWWIRRILRGAEELLP